MIGTDDDYRSYLNRYSDLRAAFGDDLDKARQHYKDYGKAEGRTFKDDPAEGRIKDSPDDYFDINKFEQLLGRLEGSKGRQQRQKSVEGRRDIYAQGLASMMSNF
jgi:hypothetical protein